MHIVALPILHNRVSRIVPTLGSAAQLHAVTENIDNLPFAFITPLRTENDCRHLGNSLGGSVVCVLIESPFY
jgi:hypothetical protein